MPATGTFVDANLLVLLVVGNVDTDLIAKHRRLRGYSVADYEILLAVLFSSANRIFVTPNTLTEASNLLGQHGEPERSLLMAGLRLLIDASEEIVVSSTQAAASPDFGRLGLSDAALLEAINENTPLVTADLNLYLAALGKGDNVAIYFREFMQHT